MGENKEFKKALYWFGRNVISTLHEQVVKIRDEGGNIDHVVEYFDRLIKLGFTTDWRERWGGESDALQA